MRLTMRAFRGRRSRVVLTPRRWRQVGGSNSAGDGDNKARSPGRARRKPLKPSRAGMPGYSGEPRGDYARMLSIFACEAAGALSTRHSPRPRFVSGETIMRLGRRRAAGLRRCVPLLASSPRKRGPITTGLSAVHRSRRTGPIKTSAAEYGSLLPQGRRRMVGKANGSRKCG